MIDLNDAKVSKRPFKAKLSKFCGGGSFQTLQNAPKSYARALTTLTLQFWSDEIIPWESWLTVRKRLGPCLLSGKFFSRGMWVEDQCIATLPTLLAQRREERVKRTDVNKNDNLSWRRKGAQKEITEIRGWWRSKPVVLKSFFHTSPYKLKHCQFFPNKNHKKYNCEKFAQPTVKKQ